MSSQLSMFSQVNSQATVEGIVDHIVYQNKNNFWTVARVKLSNGGDGVITGILNGDILGKTIRAKGHYQKHPKYGEQFKVESFNEIEPETEEGLVAFLSGKKFKGIGPKKAEAVVHAFGDKTLDILANDPEYAVTVVKSLTYANALTAQKVINENIEMIHTVARLRDLGLTETMAAKAAEHFGKDADQTIKENPYKLVELDGVGFKKADEIALYNGIAADSDIRIRNGLLFVLKEETATHGHVYLTEDVLVRKSEELLFSGNLDDIVPELENKVFSGINYLNIEGRVSIAHGEGWRHVYLPPLYRSECNVKLDLKRLANCEVSEICDLERYIRESEKEVSFECGRDITFDKSQLDAIYDIANEPLSVLTGGPGTGKTTIIRTLVKVCESNGMVVSLAAPTGRAAKRMKDSCHHEAYTIHKLLQFQARGVDEDDKESLKGVFQVNHNNPLISDVLIVDESSMIDLPLMGHLLDAIQNGTRVVLVGDVEQLPPVGPGQPFADIIAGKYAKVVRLQTPHRQANGSTLPLVAHQMLEGHIPPADKYSDFKVIPAEDTDEIASKLNHLLEIYHKHGGSIDDLQILCPIKKGQAGTIMCNLRAQAIFNPPSPEKAEYKRSILLPDPEHPGQKKRVDAFYRVGDKVIQTKNLYKAHVVGLGWLNPSTGDVLIKPIENKNGYSEESVSNGEIGKIYSVLAETDDKGVQYYIEILFDDGRLIKYAEKDFKLFQHAFAITIHKSQGCEFPQVIISLPGGSPDFINRQLIYTAVTRAKQEACVIGKNKNFAFAVKNNKSRKRNSGLVV